MGYVLTDSSWLVFKIVDIVKHRATQHDAVLATGIITNAFVIISVLSAFPWVRKSVLPLLRFHTIRDAY
jgi:hypothetical protein